MFIIKAIAFAFILFIALVFLGVLRLVFGAKVRMRRFGDAFFGSTDNASEEREDREKVFDSNDGEYVDFEELPGETHTDDPDRKTAADYRAMITGDEGQVSDADYEEIK